jgi:CRP/FNR family transcriptional regulator
MVGSVREVVQRALKDLERDGAIALERTRVRIRDQAKLEHRAHLSV